MKRILPCLVLLAGVAVAAQQGPTFKVAVDYVEVDAVVTDGEGHFVRDLTKDDFEVLEDNKPQAISTFSTVDKIGRAHV